MNKGFTLWYNITNERRWWKVSKEHMAVFKAYLRNLMRQLKAMEKAFQENDTENAKKILEELIEDTQHSIED